MLMRIVFSLFYALLLLSMSGLRETALAVVSCQDRITPGGAYRYGDALALFTEYQGKTYAIAKSAVTGVTTLPDGYFNLSANISREYAMTGVDTASLKALLILGNYGAARPVTIDSAALQQFLLKRFGAYLGNAADPASSYLNAWKGFGAVGFTTIDGLALPYTNWGGPVFTGPEPQAVVMGKDGIWTSGLDGPRTAQIVEFPGQLDCALSLTPVVIPEPPPPPPPPPPVPGALPAIYCGQDLNNNGYTGDPGEVLNCVQTAQGQFCPVGARECTATYQAATCPTGTALDPQTNLCRADPVYACPAGYRYNSTTARCEQAVTCPEGAQYQAASGQCEQTIVSSYQASPLLYYNLIPVSVFTAFPDISVPFVWAFLGVRPATLIQPAYIASSTAYIDPATCAPSGLPGWSSCLSAVAAYTCPSGGTLSGDQCVTTTVTGTAPTCTGGTLDTTAGLCWTAAPAPCPGGTTLDSLSGKCQSTPGCGAGSYDLATGSCFMGNTTCPSGNQARCMEYQGRMQCSPNPCFDPATPGNQQTTTQNDAMLQNDGPKDAAGNCLGQLYIFNGKPSRCRPPGLRVGMINNCCDSDETVSEDLGTSIQTVANTIQTAYEIGQVAYYGNALVTGAAEIASISTTATGAVTSMTVVTATGTTATLSGATAAGAYGAVASGTTGVSAMTAGIEAYAGALLNPATIVVAVVVMVVMRVLFGGGCDEKDLQTGSQVAGKDCHYVGDYCELKWPLVGCVQQAKSYCCFNSKMARIIHEQGRPQLQAFQPNGAWGVPELPNCRGFTPEEFQGLDFSRIDLSEYFADLQKELAGKIQGSQATIMQNIQNRYQALPK